MLRVMKTHFASTAWSCGRIPNLENGGFKTRYVVIGVMQNALYPQNQQKSLYVVYLKSK